MRSKNYKDETGNMDRGDVIAKMLRNLPLTQTFIRKIIDPLGYITIKTTNTSTSKLKDIEKALAEGCKRFSIGKVKCLRHQIWEDLDNGDIYINVMEDGGSI